MVPDLVGRRRLIWVMTRFCRMETCTPGFQKHCLSSSNGSQRGSCMHRNKRQCAKELLIPIILACARGSSTCVEC